MTQHRWTICALLFFATTINYLDRQVLSLTWKDFIAPEFHWTDAHYGLIAAIFSLVYAFGMLFAGRFVDKLGTKKGFLWAIGVWSVGACLHALCGIATQWWVGIEGYDAMVAISCAKTVANIISVSVVLMIFARVVLAIGEAGNFPAAIKATAEYFPKKDRALATAIFNAGATVGALAAPLCIPLLAKHYGWEMSFLIIGALGFLWMGWWTFAYDKPEKHRKVNAEELAYIMQDKDEVVVSAETQEKKLSWGQCFKFKQTWAFAIGKFMTDGVWWFFLFWTPAYLSDVYGLKSSDTMGQLAIFTLYAIVMISIYTGGKLPSYFMVRKGLDPYAGRMRAMLIFAFFPLLTLLAQPLGPYSFWFPVIIIGIAGAAHQSWSANLFSTVSDMIPKSAVATVVGIGGMAGGIGSFIINMGSGVLFTHAYETNMTFMGFSGKPAGYFIVFCVCAVAYLIGWVIMKRLVPKYKKVEI
ncbi:MAG: MFS transporter [Bacteroidales bacterium]|nr:MFS transporter [Bacteroidales bacterium]MCL2132802.1 MFS transporter [Bacteroidales bacterium]